MAHRNFLLNIPYDIPLEIQHMAKEAQLGELCKVYNRDKKDVGILLIVMSSTILGIPALVLIPLAVFSNIDLVLMLIIGFPFLLLGLPMLWAGCNLVFHRGIYPYWHIYLWQNGFVYQKGKVRLAFRWDQIASIKGYVKQVEYHSTYRRHSFVEERTTYSYKVRHQDGNEIELNNIFPEIVELIDIVLEESARQLAPREVNVAHPRSIVAFTHFALDQQGIGNEQEQVSWEEMREIAMKYGVAIVRKVEK